MLAQLFDQVQPRTPQASTTNQLKKDSVTATIIHHQLSIIN
jgi:hypothetical protein